MQDDLKAYEHLWTSEKQQWVLLTDEESTTQHDYVPYHIKSWRILDLDDDALMAAIIAQMVEAGVPKVTDEDIFGRPPKKNR